MDIISGLSLLSGGFGIISGISTNKRLDSIVERIDKLKNVLTIQNKREDDIARILSIARTLEDSLFALDLSTSQFIDNKQLIGLNHKIKKLSFSNPHLFDAKDTLTPNCFLWNDMDGKLTLGGLNQKSLKELHKTFAEEQLYFPQSLSWGDLPINSFGYVSGIMPNPVAPGQVVSISISLDTNIFGHGGFETSGPMIDRISILTSRGRYPINLYGGGCSSGPDYRELNSVFIMPDVRPSDYVNISVGVDYLGNSIELLDNKTNILLRDLPVTPSLSDHHIIWDYNDGPIISLICFGVAKHSASIVGQNIVYIKQGMKTKVIEDPSVRLGVSSRGAALEFPPPSWLHSGEFEITIQSFVNNVPSKMSKKQIVNIDLASHSINILSDELRDKETRP
ncbi:MAG: hypothetical protein KAS04_02470 [Candidatus Aenigmarchaeota archaeon]|nr:hypothetical protein [Candidatus Aenigmarchaeota archaeon]